MSKQGSENNDSFVHYFRENCVDKWDSFCYYIKALRAYDTKTQNFKNFSKNFEKSS